jgi:hypothetical protein
VATTTMTTVDAILKEVYEEGMNDQLQSDVLTLRRIERSSDGVTHHVGGKYVRFGVRIKRNHGIGARNENEALPVARTQTYEDAQVSLKYLYGSLELTGQTFELADKDYQAFASVLDQEMNGLKEGLAKDTNRQVYGDGTGTLATATGAGTTTTFVTTNAQYLEEGMIVDIIDSDGTTVNANGAEITSIVTAAGVSTVTFTPAGVAMAAGDKIYRDDSKNKEMNGLGSIVKASGTLYGIDPNTVGVWKSTVNNNSGTPRPLSEGLMIQTVDAVRTKGGGTPTVIFTSLGVRRSYFNLLVQQRRSTNTTDFKGGFTGLEFLVGGRSIPLVEDVDAPPNKMFFVNEKEIKLYEAGDWSFMNRDGSNWDRVVTSAGKFDAYQATMYKYCEIGTHRRNAHALLDDITEG